MIEPERNQHPHPSGREPEVGDWVRYVPRDLGIALPAIVVFVASDSSLGLRVFAPEARSPRFVDHRRWDPAGTISTWHWPGEVQATQGNHL